MNSVGLLTAVAGGFISFVSPCVLPLVPPYLCYIAGVSIEELEGSRPGEAMTKGVVPASLAFVLGFSTVFVALGATASVIGQTVASHLNTLTVIGGVLVILMGLHFLGLFRLAFLNREARLHVRDVRPGLAGAYVLGLAFAFGWTPCIGPVLAAILGVAGATETVGEGALLLALYSLGLGLPFIAAAFFAPLFLNWLRGFRRFLPAVEKGMGAFLVLTGIFFITGQVATVSYWMLEAFPGLATLG
jgi:cytochrome c-type biogenesis protein